MNQEAVSVNVRYARQAHHVALWAATMAAKFPEAGRLYAEMAKRNRATKRDFMKRARRLAS